MATNIRYILKNDIASNWEDKNTLLLKGEPGYDRTNNRLKFGNGNTSWNDLPYLAPDVVDDLTTGGSDKVLSAEQGKKLKAMIENIDIPEATTYSLATQSVNGLMSAVDKKKLDGVAEGANKVNVSSETWTFTLSSGSTVTKKVAIMS
ncbi:MAG: hypothetical protein IJP88_07415 [Synergistaceae bacterium]|nr:hypothetical protein [Synergistaceae bacterium]